MLFWYREEKGNTINLLLMQSLLEILAIRLDMLLSDNFLFLTPQRYLDGWQKARNESYVFFAVCFYVYGEHMEIIYKKPSELTPYKNNSRDNDGAVDYVMRSIDSFGFKVPIVIDADGVVVCGHTKLKAAKKLHLEKVPCIVANDLTDDQAFDGWLTRHQRTYGYKFVHKKVKL